jgi:hypothetical protein
MKALAYWWLLFWVQAIAYAAAWFFGIFQLTWHADVSKLSFVIMVLHLFATCMIGVQINTARKGLTVDVGHGHFLASAASKIGMLGTIIGFIFMITGTMDTITAANMTTEQLRSMMGSLASGIGTALWTTLWGLVVALMIEVQLHVLEHTE